MSSFITNTSSTKGNVLELIEIGPDGGVETIYEHPLFANITDIKSVSIPNCEKELLIILGDAGQRLAIVDVIETRTSKSKVKEARFRSLASIAIPPSHATKGAHTSFRQAGLHLACDNISMCLLSNNRHFESTNKMVFFICTA